MARGVLSGYVNVFPVIPPSTSVAASITSDYVKLDKWDKVIFVVECGSGLSNTGQFTCSLQSAYTSTGGGATAIGVYTTMGAGTANNVTKASAVLIDNASSWDAGETLVVNGITYTMASTSSISSSSLSTALFNANRYIHSSSDMTNASGAAQHLAAYINNADYGISGLTAIPGGNILATASSNNVYITGGGESYITVTASATDIQVMALKHISTLETNGSELLANSSHKWVAVVVTCTSDTPISAIAIRSGGRYHGNPESDVTDYDYGV